MTGRRPGPWVTVAAAFALMVVAVGAGYAYGVLVLPLTRDLGVGQAAAAGVFSVTVATFFLAGAAAGALTDRWGPGPVLLLGAVALGGGFALTAAAPSLAAVYLGHGVLVGVGMSTTFVPLVAVVGASFQAQRSLALGLAVSGIGIGTLVMAPLIATAIRLVGWRGAYAALAALGAVALVAGAAVLRGGPAPHGGRPAATAGARQTLASRDFRLLYAAQMLLAVALFLPFSHLPAFAESAGTGAVAAAGLVGLVGGASVVGRLVLGPVADRVGALSTYRWCFVAVAVSFVPWLAAAADAGGGPRLGSGSGPAYPLLIVHAVVFGLGYGGFVALLPAVVADRFGVAGLGSVIGVLYTANVLGAGVGPWGTGMLVERQGYAPAGVVGLACALAGAALLVRIRRPDRRRADRDADRGAGHAVDRGGTGSRA